MAFIKDRMNTCFSLHYLRTIWAYVQENFSLLFRYGVSGGLGVVANILTFSFLVDWMKIWYVYGAVGAFVVAYVVTFSLHKWWTFKATASSRTVTQGMLYLFSALSSLCVTVAVLYVLVDWFNFWPTFAQCIALGVTALLSFIFTVHVTFHADETRLKKIVTAISQRHTTWMGYHSYWVSLLFLILASLALVRLSEMPVVFNSDSAGFASTADLLLGESAEFNGARYLKPLAPSVIALLTFFGIETEFGVLVQAVLMYFLLGLSVYFFGVSLFTKKASAFVLAVVVAGSFPMLKYGLDYYTESGAWALYFLSLTGMVAWYKNPQRTWLWFTSLMLLAGVLWKEYAVLAGLTFFLLICFQTKLTLKERFLVVLEVATLALLPWLIWQYYVYSTYHYSYFDWFEIGTASEAYATMYTIPAVVKSVFVLLGIGWIYFIWGITRWSSLSILVKQISYAMFLPAFGFLLWGYVSSRLFFSLVPLASIFVAVGVMAIQRNSYRFFMILFYLFASVLLVWISFVPDIRTLLDMITYG
jgi:putative flippase GtrA